MVAEGQLVFRRVGAEGVAIDLDVVAAVRLLRDICIARVPEAARVCGPGQAAAGGGILHAGDGRFDLLAVGDAEDMQGSVFAAALG